jgi:DNA-binding response OmpR family regulator
MPESKRVLIIEDDQLILESLLIKLDHAGIKAVKAETGKEGLALLQSDPHFDLILLDILMPDGDGFLFLEEKQKNLQIAPIPTLVLTNLTQKEYVARAHELGAFGYLIKADHSLAEVVDIIEKCFRGEPCIVDDIVL